jgi:hypothetical protein
MPDSDLKQQRNAKLAELTQAENRARHWKQCAADLQREIGRIEAQMLPAAGRTNTRRAPLARQEEW